MAGATPFETVKLAFATLVATVGASLSTLAPGAPPAVTDTQRRHDAAIVERIAQAAQAAQTAFALAELQRRPVQPVYLALQDGLGRMRAIALEPHDLGPIVQHAAQYGRAASVLGNGMQMLQVALALSDRDFFAGAQEIAMRFSPAEQARRRAGESTPGLGGAGARRQIEDAFRD